jgi:hypothetical protein
MYLPESDVQLYEILSDLRVYADQNGMPRLSEQLDDALLLLTVEARRNQTRRAASEDAR